MQLIIESKSEVLHEFKTTGSTKNHTEVHIFVNCLGIKASSISQTTNNDIVNKYNGRWV